MKTKAQRTSMSRRLVVSAVGVSLVAFVALSAVAQTPIPPTIRSGEDQAKQHKIVLDKDARLAADEYADLLRQLQDVVKDYSGYLKDEQSGKLKQCRETLQKLKVQLGNGLYADHADQLSDDLDRQLDQLSELETVMRESSETYSMRTYRLVKSLHRELAGINDLVQNDLAERLKMHDEYQRQIAEYVRAVLENVNVQVQTAPDGQTTIVVKTPPAAVAPKVADGKKQRVYVVAGGSNGSNGSKGSKGSKGSNGSNGAKDVEAIVPVPDFSEDSSFSVRVAIPDISSDAPGAHAYGESFSGGIEKEFFDSVDVSSPKGVIRIDNKMGQVTVTGTQLNQITAHLTISYTADTRAMEKEFARAIKLTVNQVGDYYQVSSAIPRVDGSGVKVYGSSLEIEVPSRHAVVLANNLGEASVSDMQADVEVTTSYSKVDVSNVTGAVKVTSSTGEVSLSEIKGPLKVRNTYSPIVISDCRGDMDIVGAYCPLTLSDCRGQVTIHNSAAIEISDHVGDLTLDNSFGPIEIHDLKGSIHAANKFQPISVNGVRGEVTVEGINSPIDLADISGAVIATTRFGQITAEELQGPMTLTNQNGSITVSLADNFRGRSSISTSFGNISLEVPQEANLLVNAKSSAGSITSFKPFRFSEDGFNKAGILRLGNGRDSLVMVATNASITIDSK